MLPPDTVLQKRYRIMRPLGRGGMGAVYEAERQRASAPTQQVQGAYTNPYVPPRTLSPRPRRKPLLILLASSLIAAVVIVAAVALGRRSGDGAQGNQNGAASPQPAATSGADGTAGSTPPPTRAQNIVENLNGVPLEVVAVPAGNFMMGTPAGEGYNSERPQRRVTVPAFYMGKYEVTQRQYKAVMGVNPSEFKGDILPVENVSWADAVEFCDRLSRMTGRKYRLPSEAEWEYACRAGTSTRYAFGDKITSEQANFDADASGGGAQLGGSAQKTTPVGMFMANGFGLHDMHGNVWEWRLDLYHNNYDGAPADGSAWEEMAAGPRILRGGSWLSNQSGLRSAVREKEDPKESRPFYGFRVAVSVSE